MHNKNESHIRQETHIWKYQIPFDVGEPVGLQVKPGWSGIKCHQNTATFILLSFLYDCLHAEIAKWSFCDRDDMVANPKILTIWLCTEKLVENCFS